MPLHILPTSEGWGETIGKGLGNGISAALQGLAEGKLAKMKQAQQYDQNVRGLKALGVQNAEDVAHLPSNLLDMFVKQKIEEPSHKNYANALSSILGGGQYEKTQTPAFSESKEPEFVRKEVTPSQKSQLKKYIESPQGKAKYSPKQIKQINEYLAKPSASVNAKNPKFVAPQPVPEQKQKGVQLEGLNPKQATEIAKLALEQQKLARQERSEAFKETKALREELRTKKNSAKAKLEDLDRMEELEKEGKLDTAGYSEFLKRSGLDIPALMSEGSEEFNKIATNFIRDAKEYFGGRISNFEIEQFLKTVPSLSQSPEGRKRVIANLRRIEQLGVATYDAYKEVLKENGGVPPLDLGEQVDDKLDKKREAITKRFKEDLVKPVPQSQNQLVTAVQSGLGSIIGAPGSLLSKIGGGLGALL